MFYIGYFLVSCHLLLNNVELLFIVCSFFNIGDTVNESLPSCQFEDLDFIWCLLYSHCKRVDLLKMPQASHAKSL